MILASFNSSPKAGYFGFGVLGGIVLVLVVAGFEPPPLADAEIFPS